MLLLIRKHLVNIVKLVSILTVITGGLGCSSQRTASVSDRSIQHSSSEKVHVVTQGETLFSIAWRYGLDYKKVASINGINPPYIIRPSQRIQLNSITKNSKVPAQKSSSESVSAVPSTLQNPLSKNPLSSKIRSEKKPSTVEPYTDSSFAQGTLKWQWPVPGQILARFQGATGLNKGIDLGGKLGEPVIAAAPGQVVYAGGGLRGYGKLLIIKHNEFFLSAYAHNNELRVKEGDFVKVGQKIADMGSSGTDRVKLHFEIRNAGNPVDPLKYLPQR